MANPAVVQRVAELAQHYTPSDETLAFARSLDIVTVSGPTGVGKDTVMEATGLPMVSGWTSREPSERDGAKFQYIASEQQWEWLEEELRSGRFVQATMHPTTGNFYGSTTTDYHAGTVNLIDVVPQQVDDFRMSNLFGSVRSAYITVAGYAALHERLAKRSPMNSDDRAKRLREAASSLSFALQDENNNFYFILNESRDEATRRLREFATEDKRHPWVDTAGRRAGRVILDGVRAQLQL